MSADDEFCKCGQPNYPRERRWYAANYARLFELARRGDADAQKVVDRAADLAATQVKLGTLCGSEEGGAAVEALMLAVRAVMPTAPVAPAKALAKDLPS